ncbi:unnamed protein product (macronuclear) [Paramecium tetraurelia]|uniref:Uncharacterized protein n=1 Tax=Paramecium tetraurelia TaxID=5888 RepID=A0DB71_PARTE|nr:uncharacterized protein GSPATT00015182001 [Paramecium tetraurelia]CAK80288.1 unnamed protein product [Paramecium tetraurelia]|eukprot:XP_001447685.1 hypothetical protein (macronuclear) [Paramecium tetraurelia strain d4-2]
MRLLQIELGLLLRKTTVQQANPYLRYRIVADELNDYCQTETFMSYSSKYLILCNSTETRKDYKFTVNENLYSQIIELFNYIKTVPKIANYVSISPLISKLLKQS